MARKNGTWKQACPTPPAAKRPVAFRDDLARRQRAEPSVRLAYLFGSWVCGAARSDSDVDVRRVGKTGEIDPALSRQLQGWAGFRNVLVHDHLTLDHRIAYRTIHSDLGDLDAFRRWALGKLDAD